MTRSRRRQLVIDTDVTGAAGPKAGISLACARFLEAVRETGHRVVRTDTLREEWKRHKSRFAVRWLRTMHGMRKVDPIEVEPDEKLRSALILGAKPKDSEIMLKDAHLLEAARAAEMRIVSKDVDCRRCFRIAAKRVVAIREICWVDPTAATEEPVEWLHRGAPLDRHRLLGSDGG